jgi:hypothetical protein
VAVSQSRICWRPATSPSPQAARRAPSGLNFTWRGKLPAGHLLVQPGAGKRPVAVGRDPGDVQCCRRLLNGHPGEVTEGDQPGLDRVELLQPAEGLVQGEQVVWGQAGRQVSEFDLDPLPAAAVFGPLLASGGLHHDPPHGLRGGSEEVAARVPRPLFSADQPKVRLVDQGGRLKGVAGRLGGQAGGGEAAQFVVNQRQELRGGVRVAPVHGAQQLPLSEVQLRPLSQQFEQLLRQVEMVFGPGEEGGQHSVDRLSDGLRSLFYLTLIATIFDVEQSLGV